MKLRWLRLAALAVAVALAAGAAGAPLASVAAVQADDDDLRMDGLVVDFALRPVLRVKSAEGSLARWMPALFTPLPSGHGARSIIAAVPVAREAIPTVLRM